MKVCFPVKEARGLESEVYGHFGSAPLFVMVDTDTMEVSTISNSDQQHASGMCSPLRALGGRSIDCVVVGGIGGGALMKLRMSGIAAYKASAETVKENLELLGSGRLFEFSPEAVCSGHSRGGCAHS